jgi:hypothetical protein
MSKGHKPGGGIKSRNVVEKGVRTGRGAKAIVPAGAAQLGQRQGNHPTNRNATSYGGVEIYSEGRGYNKAQYGNEMALRCSGNKAGPGCDREVMRSGAQGTHGTPASGNPLPRAAELWPGWKR